MASDDEVRECSKHLHAVFYHLPQDCVIVSRQALQEWLSVHSVAGLFPNEEKPDSVLSPIQIDIGDILCKHGLLDHRHADKMKRISRVRNSWKFYAVFTHVPFNNLGSLYKDHERYKLCV